jgi:uncharacterized OB-fold protein
MASRLPTPAPEQNPETEGFWKATTQGHLLLPRCDSCGVFIWYPRTLCPDCGSHSVGWTEASGLGTVYSYSVVHRSSGEYQGAVPYVVAYVELAEGPRVLTNIIGSDPDRVYIGQPVRAVFCDTGEHSALYRFEPTEQR